MCFLEFNYYPAWWHIEYTYCTEDDVRWGRIAHVLEGKIRMKMVLKN